MKQISYQENQQKNNRGNRIAPSLTQRIVKSDRWSKRLLLIVIVQVLLMVLYYFALYIARFLGHGDQSELYFYGFSSTGFLAALPYVIYKYREFKNVDYSENTRDFLTKAIKRLRFRADEFVYLIPFFLLLDVALCMAAIKNMELWGLSNLARIVVVQVAFIPYLGLATIAGYFIWKKKKRPILWEVEELQKQFTGSDPLDF